MNTGKLRLQGIGFIFSLLMCLPYQAMANTPNFEMEVNLALREIGHKLLLQQGDSTSAIPPVVFEKDRGFYLKFGGALDYEKLQALVEETFQTKGLPSTYSLALFDCETDVLMLGYSTGEVRPSRASEEVSCLGRDELSDCYHLAINFPPKTEKEDTFLLVAAIVPIVVLFLGGFWWWKQTQPTKPIPGQRQAEAVPEKPSYQLGPLRFEPENQTLLGGGEPQRLTFRESKLLDLFCQNKNQLLPRESILEFVWGDEGVMVGRSIDVFVSRLRKKLKAADNIKIASVHGVGYRMEIEEQQSVGKAKDSQ
ncbi:MAG: winged helix-turn-helix domain-containing protein, partial [Bacteroidota bacterium]